MYSVYTHLMNANAAHVSSHYCHAGVVCSTWEFFFLSHLSAHTNQKVSMIAVLNICCCCWCWWWLPAQPDLFSLHVEPAPHPLLPLLIHHHHRQQHFLMWPEYQSYC